MSLIGNDLNGEKPAEPGSPSDLTSLRIGDNELSGYVPSSLEDQLDLGFSDLGDLPFC